VEAIHSFDESRQRRCGNRVVEHSHRTSGTILQAVHRRIASKTASNLHKCVL
jgi:hypothetical protein